MRKSNSQLKLIVEGSLQSNQQTDTSGNPSETYHGGHMAAVRREWKHEFSMGYVNDFALTLPEILSIERRVRRELYP